MELDASHRIPVIESLAALVQALSRLRTCIEQETHKLWLQGISDNMQFVQTKPEYLQIALRYICSRHYDDDQDPRATKKLNGVLLVGPNTISQARIANGCKDAFRLCVLSAREQIGIRSCNALLADPDVRRALAVTGEARLCLKEAYRHIPVLADPPSAIAWTQKRSRSINRINVEDAVERLTTLNSVQAQIDRETLSRLPGGTPLAIVQQNEQPAMKANVTWSRPGGNNLVQIHAPIPILCGTGPEEPCLRLPAAPRNQIRSADRQLANTPILPSIRAYLYEMNGDHA